MTPKTTQFKRMLLTRQVEFLMEAHNGLSAKIVEEAGFKGIWASGLSMSASLGVRDNNEASWTQILEIVEFMSDASTIPILIDADTGYGNFNNVRRLVRKLEQRNVAAMCIEDKLFPKTNSFIGGERQPLADVNEFSDKIRAAKDTQQDPDFCVVARTEAFIAGWGKAEALRRAEAYYRAGADAILVHSKKSTPDEVLSFMKEWGDTCPVVIVPTMYYDTPTEHFAEAGISTVIWANHLMRACVTTMQKTAATIHREQSLASVEKSIIPVKEVFRLQNAEELKAAEKRYLPDSGSKTKAIVLMSDHAEVALQYTNLMPVHNGNGSNGTSSQHAARNGKNGHASLPSPITRTGALQRQVGQFQRGGIKDILVVNGDNSEADRVAGVKTLADPDPKNTRDLASLAVALDQLEGSLFISSGNILFKQRVLLGLQEEPGDIVLAVDTNVSGSRNMARWTNFVRCSRRNCGGFFDEPPSVEEFTPQLPDGEWIGLLKLSPEGTHHVRQAILELQDDASFQCMKMDDLFEHLLGKGIRINVMYITGQWCRLECQQDTSPAVVAQI